MARESFPLVARANQFARDVVRGKVPASRWVNLACQRHLDDLVSSRSASFKYKFDSAKAEKKLRLIQLLPHTKGEWAYKRQLVTLEPWQLFGLACTFGWVKKKTGFRRFRESYWEVPRKNGKALAIDTPVATPNGWKRHGDLRAGDIVFAADGNPQRVLAVTEHYAGPCMELRLSDGETIVAHERHEWVTQRTWYTKRPKGSRAPLPTVETREIAETLRGGARGDFVHRIALAGALQLPEAKLPVPPYVLGAWLGDGHSRSANITSADPGIPEEIRRSGVPCIEVARFRNETKLYRLSDGDRSQKARNKCVAARLRQLGLLWPNHKHIPAQYLRASFDQRLELLRGLIDTDGYVSVQGQVVFGTISAHLADDVMELLRSLGMKPSMRMDRASLNGKDCGANYEIQFWPPDGLSVAHLERKRSRQLAPHGKKRRSASRTVVSATPVGDQVVNCIQVETGVYLAGRGMVLTHNSVIAAGVGIAMFTADDEFGAEVYCGATTERQAWEVFRPARLMVKRSPMLVEHLGIEVNAQALNRPEDGSRFEPIIGNPGDGASPSCAIEDEYHEHDTNAQYETMITGMGARRQPLMFIITTSGANIEGPCYDKRRQVIEMLEGTVPDDELFGWIWTIDEGDDWTDPRVLAKANPNIGVSVYQEYLESQQQRAIKSARFTNTFKTKHLNVWTSAKTGYFNLEDWKACEDRTLTLEQFEGQDCVLALDMARKLDLNSMARLLWRDIDGRRHYFCVAPRFWVPEDTVRTTENRRMAERYQAWVNQGFLLETDGAEIDYRDILEEAKDANRVCPVQCTPLDPHGATNLSHQLEDEGLTPVTIVQNYTNMSDPMKELEAAITSGRFHHDGNPIMTWCVSNVIGKNLPGNDDVVRPIKQGNDNKIDGAVALIMAIGRAMLADRVNSESIYDQGVGV
ncbi:terminase TerL endonuclease subunit [Burkholderia lata]|uniref:terminase TerL endonuclease subunit n=1 Tax=Burkholderia lata (strain ATCC 17760 / DSM 23089 / LMG 22485 / NCIMB 9086 / R18194 / 383) TaxID=482957 RepID=UPI00399A2D81